MFPLQPNLIHMLPINGYSHTTQQQPRISIVRRRRMHHHEDTRDHLGRIAVVIDGHLGKGPDGLGRKAETQVTATVTTTTLDTLPLLDDRKDGFDAFGQEIVHGFARQRAGQGNGFAHPLLEAGLADVGGAPGQVHVSTHRGDGLQDHAGDVKVG